MDRRRNYGPETTQPASRQAKDVDCLPRSDGRAKTQTRPVFARLNSVSKATGSAYMEQENTKVTASIELIPVSRSGKQLVVDFRFAPFAHLKRKGYQRDVIERDYALIIEEALLPAIRLVPDIQITVLVVVLQSDGMAASLAASITAASMALANAEIEMYDRVIGSAVAFMSAGLFLDPTKDEEDVAKGTVVIAYMPSRAQISHIMQVGRVEKHLAEAIDTSLDACNSLDAVLQKVLLDSLTTQI